MLVNIGKGLDLDCELSAIGVDESALTPVQVHCYYIGLKNILQDAHANVNNKGNVEKYKDWSDAQIADESLKVAEAKWESLQRGEVSVAGEREGDPVEQRALLIATKHVKKSIKAAGKKVADFKASDLRKLAKALLDKNPGLRKEAQSQIDAERATAVDVSGLVI